MQRVVPKKKKQEKNATEFRNREFIALTGWDFLTVFFLLFYRLRIFVNRIRADGPYCHSQCPELDACISETLWCDGVEHCPSGYDESFGYCMHLLYTHLVYSIALTVAIVIVAVSSGLTVLWFRRFRSASAAGCRSPSAKAAETEAVVSARDVVY